MLSVHQLQVHFADRALFENESFLINKQDKIALVGRNGVGKSSLLKILAGLNPHYSGTISFPNDFSLAYLPQDMDFNDFRTVFNEVKSSFIEVIHTENRIAEINEELSSREDYESDAYLALLDELGFLNERFQILDGYTLDASIELVLKGLGFSMANMEQLCSEFSGGWRMRIELAKVLLKKADLLLLDEPTNHLDIHSISWLELFLKNYSGAVLLISHDRKFLDTVTNRTLEISLGKIIDYKCNYSGYLEQKEMRIDLQQKAFDNQQKKIQETERFIERFKAKASKATQAQSKLKQLEKIDRIVLEEQEGDAMNFYFPPSPHGGKVVLEVKHVSKSYGEKQILSDINFIISKNEKIAFLGKNGEGKSTMVKMIVGETDYEGTIDLGYQIKVGYYAQEHLKLSDTKKTLLEVIEDAASDDNRKHARTLLGAFMFKGDDVYKKVSVLSGGERARLALCKLLLEPFNLLILDEPTNHLDISSKAILKEALRKYDGTLIIISHDRDFLVGLTDKTFVFQNKQIKEVLGDVNEFMQSDFFTQLDEVAKPTKEIDKKEDKHYKKKVENNLSKSSQNSIYQIEKKIELLEEDIKKLTEKAIQGYNQETNRLLTVKQNELGQLYEKLEEML